MKQLTPEQLEKLKPESREKYEKRLKAVKRNRLIVAVVSLIIVIAAVVSILCTTVFFNITSIRVVKTGSVYSENEIISASGLNTGDNIIRTDFEKVCQRIEYNLPYVLDATVNKKLSGEVTISVKDTSAAIIFESKQGYAIADSHGKVLEIINKVPEKSNFMVIKTAKGMDAEPGTVFTFSDAQEEATYYKLIKEFKNNGILESITKIDLSDISSIKIEYQNRLRLLLGTADSLDIKIKGGLEVIGTEDNKDPNLIAEINLTIPKKVFVNPIESLDPDVGEKDAVEEETTSADIQKTDAEQTTEPEDTTSDNTTSQQDNSEVTSREE